MIGRLAERFPFLAVIFFEAAEAMIQFMKQDSLRDVALIALDHDLELISTGPGQWTDPGTGLEVARYLAHRDHPLCPIIVHTSNALAGDAMLRELQDSGRSVFRVVPHDDLAWIDHDWFSAARNAIVDFAPLSRFSAATEFSAAPIAE